MIFGGFQKLTLLDYPGKVACTLFTKGCNFYCPFCHNALLVDGEETGEYTEEYILDFLKKRYGILDGVCITGGEPLINKEIKDFIKKVKELGYSIKLDTNGSFPKELKDLAENKLIDYVAMDIKNSIAKYPQTSGCEKLDTNIIEESIDFLLSGKIDFEFRTTVVRELHTISDIQDIGVRIKGAPKYFLQNFVDSGHIIGENLSPVDEETLEKMRLAALKSVKSAEIRG